MFAKDMSNGRGTINYKFVSIRTRTITAEEFKNSAKEKNKIEIDLGRDELGENLKKLRAMLTDKDQIIDKLEAKVE
jgi:hypothetical protein